MIDEEILPEYCNSLSSLKNLSQYRASKNNERAVTFIKSLTNKEISELKSKLKNFKPENFEIDGIDQKYIIFAKAHGFLQNHVFVLDTRISIERQIIIKLESILHYIHDLSQIPDILRNCNGFTHIKYKHMLEKLCMPYSEAMRYINHLFSQIYTEKGDVSNNESISLDDLSLTEVIDEVTQTDDS